MTETSSRQEKTPATISRPRIKLVALNARYTHSCLALFYIRNELAVHLPEMEVEILQLTINDNSYESLLRITADEPFGVFFSAAIWNSNKIAELAADVRACLPDCRIVVGGPEAGVLRDKLPLKCCSMVIGDIEAVDSQFYRDLISGQLQDTYQGRFLKLQDKVLGYPFRDEDFAGPLKNRHIYYESSRGCPYSCTYCLSATERGLYHKDIEQVQAELEHILSYNPRVVRFVDRTFNDLPERALAIWKFLLSCDCDTLFHFEIAPDRFTQEMFEFLETVGPNRFQFEIGIQSTNPGTLEAINRRMDIGRVGPIIEKIESLETIHLHVDLILGLPYETRESFADSFRAVFAMGAHYIQMGLLKILPDTPICHGANEYGYVHSVHPPYPVFANNWLNCSQMSVLYWFCECVEKFHNNRYFVSLWRYLRHQGGDIFSFFQLLLQEGGKVGLLQRAATQELLCEILVKVASERSDCSRICELLRYDWLRCGFRKLPSCLEHVAGEESMEMSRDILYQSLPEELTDMYTTQSRNQFFKRSVFLKLSGEVTTFLGLPGSGNAAVRVAVVQEREKTIHAHNRVFVVGEVGNGQTD
ncbi:B12-binding domain-containing radical SAM protein [Desulfopila aestuarii]|uniref:Radical SAM superfamily enzyme YgiQ, UPF0313 family n=1 Tax=Desulfopila aestuarii DSM 18488 TaxID=1121416 RepID=A0A1M7Y886_9BACT|nr:DUF4080 domain-containing protein [Desulfopila aestuarii]SHO48830.1 Radical SAM superfamily enzyme YgiQ, UPF0313 family [Desulfopila aestuarii DSM 18488]